MQGPPGLTASTSPHPAARTTGPSTTVTMHGPLLLTRDFGLVWSGQLISQIGDGISKLALLWFVYAITGSPLKTSVIALLQTIPPIVLGPFIGVYVDRLPKKMLLIASDIVRALVIGFIPCLVTVESFTVTLLYALVLLHAIATAVFGPALTAAVPAIVPRPQFTAANALLQSTTSLGVIFGPAVSGLGIAAYGSQEVLCLNAATYLASAGCLLAVRFADFAPGRVHAVARTTMLRDLVEGFRYTFINQHLILLLTGTAALYSFGTSALTALFPVFGRKMLGLGPVEVGYLWSALGIGLLVTSLGLVWITDWDLRNRMRLIAGTSVVSGAAICGLVWTPDPFQAGILLGIIGGGMGALTPIAWGIIQELAPRPLVGRVLALYGTGAMSAAIAGITAFGWITERHGPQPGLLGIGAVLFVTAFSANWMSRVVERG